MAQRSHWGSGSLFASPTSPRSSKFAPRRTTNSCRLPSPETARVGKCFKSSPGQHGLGFRPSLKKRCYLDRLNKLGTRVFPRRIGAPLEKRQLLPEQAELYKLRCGTVSAFLTSLRVPEQGKDFASPLSFHLSTDQTSWGKRSFCFWGVGEALRPTVLR